MKGKVEEYSEKFLKVIMTKQLHFIFSLFKQSKTKENNPSIQLFNFLVYSKQCSQTNKIIHISFMHLLLLIPYNTLDTDMYHLD